MRPDLEVVAALVPPGSRVLDLGCGDGALLAELTASRGCTGTGVDRDPASLRAAIRRGVPVIELDLDAGLGEFADGSYDLVVVSQTLQASRHPDRVLDEVVRIAGRGIVSVPNFGLWKHRAELALRGRDGWHAAGTVLYVYNPGAFGISEEGEVGELEFTALVPGGPSALRVDISHNRSDADIGINEAEFTSDTSTVLCGAVDGAPRCVRLPREHDYTREVMEAGGEDDEEPHEGLPIHERYVIDLAFQPEAGTVTLQASEGALPTQLARWAGSHPLLDLLRSPDLALHVDL